MANAGGLNTGRRAALAQAYCETTYRVFGPAEPIDICVGQPNVALDALLDEYGVRDWAFVTAANPQSRPLSPEENERLHAQLEQLLRASGLRYLDAVAIPDAPDWLPERGVLILDVGESEALMLSRRFRQHAIVCGSGGISPRLVWND